MTLLLTPLYTRYDYLVPGEVVPGAPLVPMGGGPSLVALSEIVAADAIIVPGTLPASTLYPSLTTYPNDNDVTPAVLGPTLAPVTEGTLTLTPLQEI